MKKGIFTLTKPEQRVVILIVMALLIAAFIRYWRDTNEQKALNQKWPANSAATPLASPQNIGPDMDEEVEADPNKSANRPSPRSSP